MTDEVLAEYKRKLGSEFGEIYYHARNEWCSLWVTWKQYESLFGHGPERVELLNSAGAAFFHQVEWRFFEAVILAVCRLSDKEKVAGKETLTVKCFAEFMTSDVRKRAIVSLLTQVDSDTEFQRDWRNRRIAHNDLRLALDARVEPLKEATREKMKRAIASLHKVFAYVELQFMSTTLSDEVVDHLDNELVTLEVLYFGTQARERALEGNYREETMSFPAWLGV
jgi:AbiU2